jgi:hypothetical protein
MARLPLTIATFALAAMAPSLVAAQQPTVVARTSEAVAIGAYAFALQKLGPQ